MKRFTYRSARSGGLLAGIIIAVGAETIVLHLYLSHKNLVAAWLVTLSTLSIIVWLAMDYYEMGNGAVIVDGDVVDLRIARRFKFQLPRSLIERAIKPTWHDIPQSGMPDAADFINLMKQSTPNVLLFLKEPFVVTRPGGIRKTVKRIAMHLDEPDLFLEELRVLQA